mgnify:CR=1 FL=1
MDFSEVVRKRRMVRHFKPDPVPREAIERILDLARRAPSAGYTQGQSFIVVMDPERRRAVAETCAEAQYVERFGQPWISEAPVQIVACTSEMAYHRRYREPDKLRPDGTEIDWPVPYWYFDIGCSVMVILLAAVNEGLAAGYAGVVDMPRLRELLGIPDEVTPVGVIPIGYPDKDVPSPSLRRGRKPVDEVIHWECWERGTLGRGLGYEHGKGT